jgi:hypothetical protein
MTTLQASILPPKRDWNRVQTRYLRDATPVRLGGITSNLSRVKSCAKNEANFNVVMGLIEETRWFIEWSGPETEIETAAYLVDVQRGLTRWKSRLAERWSNPEERIRLSEQAAEWSEQVLKLSGLLD